MSIAAFEALLFNRVGQCKLTLRRASGFFANYKPWPICKY